MLLASLCRSLGSFITFSRILLRLYINMTTTASQQTTIDQGWKILVVEWTLLSVSTIVVLLRFFVRGFIEEDHFLKRVKFRRLHVEDYLMALSVVRPQISSDTYILTDNIRSLSMVTRLLKRLVLKKDLVVTSGHSTELPSPTSATSFKSSRAFPSSRHA